MDEQCKDDDDQYTAASVEDGFLVFLEEGF
jgi:hypothetical protein